MHHTEYTAVVATLFAEIIKSTTLTPFLFTVDINRKNLTIQNITEPEHPFCCGSVTRSIVQEGSRIYVGTYGVGVNSSVFNATANYFAGNATFKPLDAGIAAYVRSVGRYSSYGAIANPNAPPPPR